MRSAPMFFSNVELVGVVPAHTATVDLFGRSMPTAGGSLSRQVDVS